MQNDESKEREEMHIGPPYPVEEGYVVLPFNEGQFKDFIRSLLGRPQTIRKSFVGIFEIEMLDIRNLYHLVLQRITQQNEGILIQFNAMIKYSDDSSIELNSIEELLTYNEVRPVTSQEVHLTWDFLVRFQDKKTPEKQHIQVSFMASPNPYVDNSLFDVENSHVLGIMGIFSRRGSVSFRIDHTARTWGADIEALLTNHIRSLLKSPSRVREFISHNAGKIGFGIAASIFVATIVISFLSIERFAGSRVAEVNDLLQSGSSTSIETINAKLNYVATFVAGGAWSQYYFVTFVFLIVSLFLAVVFGAWINNTAENTEPSFILLTKQSRQDKEKLLKRLKHKWWTFIAAVVINMAIGVVSNIIFAYFFR